jgi:hypothetical protein
MARTLQVGERITIAKLIEKLQTIQFNEITLEKVQELFVGHDIQQVNKVREDLIDIGIDDYVFTVGTYSDDEGCLNGFKLNETIRLSKNVEVWLPSDNNGSNDIQADGTIKQVDNLFFLEVTYSVD